MPHFPARIIRDRATLADWIARYKGEAGVKQALLLGGGVADAGGRVRQFDADDGDRACSTGSSGCMSRATRRATRTSTPTGRTAW